MGQGSGTPAVSDCHAHLQCLILPSLRDRERLKWTILYIEARVYTSWMFINFMYIYDCPSFKQRGVYFRFHGHDRYNQTGEEKG